MNLPVGADLVRDCGVSKTIADEICSYRLVFFNLANKKPGIAGFFIFDICLKALLDLGFLVHDMLANHRIELLDFHLFRHVALVLGGGVVMTGTGAGYKFDFVAHTVFS
jgi:hypothetical protein